MRLLVRSRLLAAVLSLVLPAFGAGSNDTEIVFNVKSHGAVGDGQTLDTAALQRTVDACRAAGGGVVYFPAGRFVSGTLTLASNLTLRLSPGAVLLGSPRNEDYPLPHLLYAKDAENVAIDGGGTIDGQGSAFRGPDGKARPRPSPLLEFIGCRNLRVSGVTLRSAPAWMLRPKNCDGVRISGVFLLNDLTAINTDGIDIDSSRNVTVTDCHVEAGDDCIVLKTTARGGPPTPTENVIVSNCVLITTQAALKIGTESRGDFRHILFSQCVIRDSRTGLAILVKDGGAVEAVEFSHITMTPKGEGEKGLVWPIIVDVEKRTDDSAISPLRDVLFSDLVLESNGRVLVQGMPGQPVQNVRFRNVTLRMSRHEEIAGAHKFYGSLNRPAKNNPDYGDRPAAFIFAHVQGLTLDGVELRWPATPTAPARHAIFGDHIDGAEITGFHGGPTGPEKERFRFLNSREVKLPSGG